MQNIEKPIFWGETWNWLSGDFVVGKAVECDIYAYRGEDRTLVAGKIKPNENHGWTVAKSDYYYIILEGSATVEVSKDGSHSNIDERYEISADSTKGASFMVKAGTVYNYRAGAEGLKFVLFMNNLWIK